MELRRETHIDGLRAVAVAGVLAFHAFPEALPGGFVGVDVFFVISGFLITSILCRDFGDRSRSGWAVLGQFYGRRVRRIFPALIVVLAACWAAGYVLMLPDEFARLSGDLVAAAGFVLNLVLSRGVGYFNTDSASNPLLHLWSLGVEEQFYLLWPLLIWLASRCRVRLLPWTVFLGALSYFWNAHRLLFASETAFFLLQTRAWELAVGGALALLRPLPGKGEPAGTELPSGLSHLLSIVGLGLVAVGFWRIRNGALYPDVRALLPTFGAALVIGAGPRGWANRLVLSQPVLVGVGLISYPLYLWHWPLLVFARLGYPEWNSPGEKLALLGAALLLAAGTYLGIERPLRHCRDRRLIPAALGTALAAVALVAAVGFKKAGLPDRFPPLIRQLNSGHLQIERFWRQGRNFLTWNQEPTEFSDDPSDHVAGRPLLYLWGDSHAASFSPGFRSCYGTRFNVIQRTAANVPPLLGPGFSEHVQSINAYVLGEIRRDRPAWVFVAANWPNYSWRDIGRTVETLRAAGVGHVVVIGPVPEWQGGLPDLLFAYARRHPGAALPTRLTEGQNPAPSQIDPEMRALAERAGAEYLSPCRVLGSPQGFLVRLGDTADSLTTFDYGHLTARGAEYVVAHFPPLMP